MPQFFDLKLLTKADAAAVFGVCTKTIDHYIRDGLLPPPIAFGSRDYWHPDVFREFLDRTFGRVAAPRDVTSDVTPASPKPLPTQPTLKPRSVHRGQQSQPAKKDSNPLVRQKNRQDALLRELNAGK